MTVEIKSRIPDIFGDVGIPAGHTFLGPKRGHFWEKKDIWSPYPCCEQTFCIKMHIDHWLSVEEKNKK